MIEPVSPTLKRSLIMKIVAVLGSPRAKSNSTALARKILSKAGELGAETREFVLNKLDFKGCQGCETCKTKLDRCVLKDDLSEVLEAVKEADALIMASPNYFGEVSSQFKAFFDRTYSFLNADFSTRVSPGKSSVFVFAQGQTDLNAYADVFPRYERWLKHYGFTENYLLRMNGPRDADSASKRDDMLQEADRIAENLTSPAG
ncbi:MAG: flavodoxin family protein [Desulfomonilaceae bacterium]|nr:flavodoxin family protein [Desulfomonilaceae bacterium]